MRDMPSCASARTAACAACASLACFFFQAEDGIRDGRVTGVQTCALPIFSGSGTTDLVFVYTIQTGDPNSSRSEERRVGKECRSRGTPEHQKKNLLELFDLGQRRRQIRDVAHRK